MALRLLGIDPNTRHGNCPTMWLDEETGDYILQGWKVSDPAMMAEIEATGPVPDHEVVLRFPRRMIQFFPKTNRGDG